MKQTIVFLLLFTAVLFTACDSFKDPAIPAINDCSFTVTNKDGIPLPNVWIKTYYTDKKTNFVVDSTCTSVLGKGMIKSLEPRTYTLKALNASGVELGTSEITVGKDNAQNVVNWTLDVFVENYTFTVTLIDNKQKPVVGRKVALLTSDDQPYSDQGRAVEY